MKKVELNDDLRPEYEVSQLKGCIRGKYAERLKHGANIIRLEQDVAQVFTNDRDVNEALRTLIRLHGGAANKSAA